MYAFVCIVEGEEGFGGRGFLQSFFSTIPCSIVVLGCKISNKIEFLYSFLNLSIGNCDIRWCICGFYYHSKVHCPASVYRYFLLSGTIKKY